MSNLPVTTETLSLTEFLLARIAEDEAIAEAAVIKAWHGHQPHPDLAVWRYNESRGEVDYDFPDSEAPDRPLYQVTTDGEGFDSVQRWAGPHIARWDPARVLAECAARREIVEHAQRARMQYYEDGPSGEWAMEQTLRDLASVWADHEDYDPSWNDESAARPG